MTVTKRDGKIEELDVTKIHKNTHYATLGLEGESADELEVKSQLHFYDGIPTSDIKQTLINTAAKNIDVDRPNATYVAARLTLYDLYHQYRANVGDFSFRRYVEHGVRVKTLNPILLTVDLDKFDTLIEIDDDKVMKRDYLFTYPAIQNFSKKVLKRDINNKLIELPQYVFLANAIILGINEDDIFAFVEKEYAYVSKHNKMTATPTLSNARSLRPQLSSCYIGATGDRIESINDTNADVSLLSKFGGGIGWDWNDIRSEHSSINNVPNASGGIVPFLKVQNDISQAVDQLGCVSADSEVLTIQSVTYRGETIDFSNGIGLLSHRDDYSNLSTLVGDMAYGLDLYDKNKASLALSCLFV